MAEESKKKHVIILGAGASVTSGYPLANELCSMMSSEKAVREQLHKIGGVSGEVINNIIQKIMDKPMMDALNLFRQGCFATVDEFSSISRLRFPIEVQNLKKLLRFVLSLRDPEENYGSSDYYPFVQKLFHNNLFPLRNDISVLTFNYDPYLPYLLNRAAGIRQKAAGSRDLGNTGYGLTSGFAHRVVGSLEDAEDLCLLKLHGSIAWPVKFDGENVVWYEDLFGGSLQQRIQVLCFSNCAQSDPPILFPWELIERRNGNFVTEEEFCLKEYPDKNGKRQGGYSGPHNLYQLFVSIWKRARKEINRATKISFIGLSMHEFLNPAFKFLFSERKEYPEIVCVNKEHEKFRSTNGIEAIKNPRSPACKLGNLLRQTGFAHGGVNIQALETFGEFIQTEMD